MPESMWAEIPIFRVLAISFTIISSKKSFMMGIVPKTKIFSQWKFCAILLKCPDLSTFFYCCWPFLRHSPMTRSPPWLWVFSPASSHPPEQGKVSWDYASVPWWEFIETYTAWTWGLINIAMGNAGTLQAGLFNYQHKQMSILLLQAGGLINWNAGDTGGAGIQLAGFLNKKCRQRIFFLEFRLPPGTWRSKPISTAWCWGFSIRTDTCEGSSSGQSTMPPTWGDCNSESPPSQTKSGESKVDYWSHRPEKSQDCKWGHSTSQSE